MSDCKHEPWMHSPGFHTGGKEMPHMIGGLLGEKAFVCRKCGVLYVSVERQREIDEEDRKTLADVKVAEEKARALAAQRRGAQ